MIFAQYQWTTPQIEHCITDIVHAWQNKDEIIAGIKSSISLYEKDWHKACQNARAIRTVAIRC